MDRVRERQRHGQEDAVRDVAEDEADGLGGLEAHLALALQAQEPGADAARLGQRILVREVRDAHGWPGLGAGHELHVLHRAGDDLAAAQRPHQDFVADHAVSFAPVLEHGAPVGSLGRAEGGGQVAKIPAAVFAQELAVQVLWDFEVEEAFQRCRASADGPDEVGGPLNIGEV